MSLKEKLAAKRALKEQKRAESQLLQVEMDSKKLVEKISENRAPFDVDGIAQAASMIDPVSGDKAFIEEFLSKKKNLALYAVVKEYLQGDWMAQFKLLISGMTTLEKKNPQMLKWEDWRRLADNAGLDEAGLSQALFLITVFRMHSNIKAQRKG